MRLFFVFLGASCAFAQVENSRVIYGSADIEQLSNTIKVVSDTRVTILQHARFDLEQGSRIEFIQPGRNSRILNRIESAYPSQIDGEIFSNGRVFLVNPAGIFFGNNARIDAAGFVAAAAKITNENFLKNKLFFEKLSGKVSNLGEINADVVGLIGTMVENLGAIAAKSKAMIVGTKDAVFIGENGSHVFLRLEKELNPITSGSADVVGSAVFQSSKGSIKAVDIEIVGDQTTLSGILDASGFDKNATIQIDSKSIALQDAALNVVSQQGGGNIRIGSIESTEAVLIDQDSNLIAHGGEKGNGGQIELYSNKLTQFDGKAWVHGGKEAGDAGKFHIESNEKVSHKSSDRIYMHSPKGEHGTLSYKQQSSLTIDQTFADSKINSIKSGKIDFHVLNKVTIDDGVDIHINQGVSSFEIFAQNGVLTHCGQITMDGGKLSLQSLDSVDFAASSCPLSLKLSGGCDASIFSAGSFTIRPNRAIDGTNASVSMQTTNRSVDLQSKVNLSGGMLSVAGNTGVNIDEMIVAKDFNASSPKSVIKKELKLSGDCLINNKDSSAPTEVYLLGGVSASNVVITDSTMIDLEGDIIASGSVTLPGQLHWKGGKINAANALTFGPADGPGEWKIKGNVMTMQGSIGAKSAPESISFKGEKLFAGGLIRATGNTIVFNNDLILTMDLNLVDAGGGIFFERNILANMPDMWTLTMTTPGDINVHGEVSLGLSSRLKALQIFNANNVTFEGNVLLEERIKQDIGTGTTIFNKKLDLTANPAAIFFDNGGEVDIKTTGDIIVKEPITTVGGDGLGFFDTPGDGGMVKLHSLLGSIIVSGITTDGGRGLLQGGNAGSIMLLDNLSTPVSTQLTYRPQGRVGILGPISAQGGSGFTAGNNGNITISGDRTNFPDIATVYGPIVGDIEITGADITLGKNSVITSFGNLNLTSTGTVTLSDQIAIDDINITANQINIITHPVGRILLSNGAVFESLLVHSTAGGQITTTVPANAIALIGTDSTVIQTNSLMLTDEGRSILKRNLLFNELPLNLNIETIESVTIGYAQYLKNPYIFTPTYDKMPEFNNNESQSMDVLAIVIEEKIKQVDPNALLVWQKVRNAILTKNPLVLPLQIYFTKLKVGIFSPNRFVSGLHFSNMGRSSLNFLKMLVELQTKVETVGGTAGVQLAQLLSEFSKPKNISQGNWDLVQKVVKLGSKPPTLP